MAEACPACGIVAGADRGGAPDCPTCGGAAPRKHARRPIAPPESERRRTPAPGDSSAAAPGRFPKLRPMDSGFRSSHSIEAGEVFSKSFRVWTANVLPFLAVTAVILSPLLLFGAYVGLLSPDDISTRKTIGLYENANTYLGAILQLLNSAALIGGVFAHLRGESVTTGSILRSGLGRVFPAVWTGIFASILVYIPMAPAIAVLFYGATSRSTALLALGGVISVAGMVGALVLSAATYVAVPASVVEKCNGFPAVKRSFALTKGERSKIFVILMALGVLTFAVTWGIRLIGDYRASIFLNMVVMVVGASFNAAFAGVVYYNLRAVKDGIGIEELAKVFD